MVFWSETLYREFYIKPAFIDYKDLYYIITASGYGRKRGLYLHRNLTLNAGCGRKNFFESKDECKEYIDKRILKENQLDCLCELHNKLNEFISEQEMLI